MPFGYKDNESKEILIWKHIDSEVVKDYKYLKEELIAHGYTIQSATLNGKRGLYKAFKDIPIQMCHFHQKKYPKGISYGHCTKIYNHET